MEPIWISRAGKRIEFNRNGQPMILNNNEDTIELLDSQGNIIDSVEYRVTRAKNFRLFLTFGEVLKAEGRGQKADE